MSTETSGFLTIAATQVDKILAAKETAEKKVVAHPKHASGATVQLDKNRILIEIQEKVNQIRTYVPKVGVFGNSGVGKSSLCNALFGAEVAEINDVEACTREPQEILVGASDDVRGIVLVDVPGIGEDPERQEEYTALYKSLAPELDLILWAIKSDDRNYASGLDAFNSIMKLKNVPPVLFVITQVDKTNDIDDWQREKYAPGGSQVENIKRKQYDIAERFDVSPKMIIPIAVKKSADNEYVSYNLVGLVDKIVEVLPNEKKYSFTREAKEESVSTQAREKAEEGVWEIVKEVAGKAWEIVKNNAVDFLVSSAPPVVAKVLKQGWDWLRSKL